MGTRIYLVEVRGKEVERHMVEATSKYQAERYVARKMIDARPITAKEALDLAGKGAKTEKAVDPDQAEMFKPGNGEDAHA